MRGLVVALALVSALGCQTLAVCDEACASACGGLIRPDDGDAPAPAPREAQAPASRGLRAMGY